MILDQQSGRVDVAIESKFSSIEVTDSHIVVNIIGSAQSLTLPAPQSLLSQSLYVLLLPSPESFMVSPVFCIGVSVDGAVIVSYSMKTY